LYALIRSSKFPTKPITIVLHVEDYEDTDADYTDLSDDNEPLVPFTVIVKKDDKVIKYYHYPIDKNMNFNPNFIPNGCQQERHQA
jgi:hypothetical protein